MLSLKTTGEGRIDHNENHRSRSCTKEFHTLNDTVTPDLLHQLRVELINSPSVRLEFHQRLMALGSLALSVNDKVTLDACKTVASTMVNIAVISKSL